jgi:hypothetical protein
MARKTDETVQFSGSAEEQRDRASEPILAALRRAEKEFREWDATCSMIDDIYSRSGSSYEQLMAMAADGGWKDAALDLFWSSFEVMKPAVYARPPKPAVKPLFNDSRKLLSTTAELLERASTSAFMRTGIDDVMCEVRDDLLFAGRGVMWLRFETDDGQRVCAEHLDRKDFLHEPARKWAEVGWVAGGFWLSRDELKKRFKKLTDDQLDAAKYTLRREQDGDSETSTQKARVWEVWHRADDKVYWVTEGVDVLLDSGPPHLKLSNSFPCPRPAYGTRKRRSLVPVPDWERYAIHFRKISDLTARIYLLLDSVKVKGLIAAGGDVGDAVEQLIAADDDQMLVPVPGAALMATGGVANLVAWLPLAEIANAITGLITARQQLISDFYELSGISDIMRGATDANETLGAQQLKSQYGSVRVRGKIDELQRIAAEAVKIAAEIIAGHFSQQTLLDMAQMELPTRKDIEKRINEIEKAAGEELKALGDKAQQAAEQVAQPQPQQGQPQQQGQQPDPQQAQQAMQQAQQQVLAKYAPMLSEAQGLVSIDDVMKLLRDDRARSFAFEIESDSTILTDELAEKQSRNDFIQAFTNAQQGLMGIAAMGEQGAKLAGEMMKFVLAPYRAGRQLDSAIDAFIDAAPEMAAQAAAQNAHGAGDEALAKANQTLADAQMKKADAAMIGVQAKAELDQADMQRRFAEMQMKGQIEADKHAREAEKLQQQLRDMAGRETLLQAQVDNLTANTAKILSSIGLDERKQQLSEYETANDAQHQAVEQARSLSNDATDQQFREQDRIDRQLLASSRPRRLSPATGPRQRPSASRSPATVPGKSRLLLARRQSAALPRPAMWPPPQQTAEARSRSAASTT